MKWILPLLALLCFADPNPSVEPGGCIAEDARLNTVLTPPKSGVDFVPITPDGQTGFYVVYSPRKNYDFNVTMSIIPVAHNQIILFGTGYGDMINSERGPEEDMALVHHVIQECLGYDSPENVQVIIVAPHWHPDHMGPESVHALRDLGYDIVSLIVHKGDIPFYRNAPDWMWNGEKPLWNDEDRAIVDVMHGGGCNNALRSINTIIGTVWVRSRAGHTPGSVDMIIDVLGDPDNRFVILGSRPGGACGAVPGQRVVMKAHGNVIL